MKLMLYALVALCLGVVTMLSQPDATPSDTAQVVTSRPAIAVAAQDATDPATTGAR